MTLKSSFTDDKFWGDWRRTDCRQFIPSKFFCGLFEIFCLSATSQAKLIGDKPVRINEIVFEIFEASLPILPCGLHDNSAQTPGVEWIFRATTRLRPLRTGNLLPYRLSVLSKKLKHLCPETRKRNSRAGISHGFLQIVKPGFSIKDIFTREARLEKPTPNLPRDSGLLQFAGAIIDVQTPFEFSNSLGTVPLRNLLIEFKLVCCKAAKSEISSRCWVKPKSNRKLACASLKNCCLVPVSST